MVRKRLDQLLVEKGLTKNRSQASHLIREGKVKDREGHLYQKPGQAVSKEIDLIVEDSHHVGRGVRKITPFIEDHQISIQGKVCLDVGASTGGFTQALLSQGAQKVTAIDIGKDQFAPELLNDARVISLEGLDIRHFESEEKFDFISIDLSFISLRNVWEKIESLVNPEGEIVMLFKPQFELNKRQFCDVELAKSLVADFQKYLEERKFQILGLSPCALKGGDGFQEYFFWVKAPSSSGN